MLNYLNYKIFVKVIGSQGNLSWGWLRLFSLTYLPMIGWLVCLSHSVSHHRYELKQMLKLFWSCRYCMKIQQYKFKTSKIGVRNVIYVSKRIGMGPVLKLSIQLYNTLRNVLVRFVCLFVRSSFVLNPTQHGQNNIQLNLSRV